jgi:hypothetical protein
MGIQDVNIKLLQLPSHIDFVYLGLVVLLFLLGWLLSKLKGNIQGLGHCLILFAPIYGIVGYFIFLILKKLGLVESLIGMVCFIRILPLFVVSFSLIVEHSPSWKTLNSKINGSLFFILFTC